MYKQIIISIMIFTFFSFSRSIESKPSIQKKQYRSDEFYYDIYYTNNFNLNSLIKFHSTFKKYSYKIYEDLNVKRPASFRISICYGAWIFKSITGQDKDVAAVYLSNRRMIVFQRPEALEKKGILARVIQHELCHYLVDGARGEMDSKARADLLWLEESFCEALSPQDNYTVYKSNKSFIKNINLEGFKKKLNQGLFSKENYHKKQSYYFAYRWGLFLLRKTGKRQFINILTSGTIPKSIKINKLFNNFQKDFFR